MIQSGKRAFLYLITDDKEKNLLIPSSNMKRISAKSSH